VEALGALLEKNPNIGIVRDELTGWLRTMERPENGNARAFYLESWEGTGSTFQIDRIGRGHLLIDHPTIHVLGGIQPGPVKAFLRMVARGEEADDGMISRFQILFWPDTGGLWRNIDRWPDTQAKSRAFEIFRRLDSLDPASIGAEPGTDDGPPFLRFEMAAQELFNEWRERLENQKLRSPDENPLVEAHLAKYRKLMPALSLLFHLANLGAGKAPLVQLGIAELAVKWCSVLEAHARRVYACVTEPAIDSAKSLADKLKEGALTDPFTFRDVYHRGWTGLEDALSVRRAVGVLEDLGWVRVIEINKTGGAPREDIYIHPKVPRKKSGYGP
jgi:putative DNA primase/helicase